MKTLVVAKGNMGKLREIAEIFPYWQVVSQKQMGFCEEVEETGKTFAENALIKARAASKALSCAVLADDSGLCVDALQGAPGIYSARYSGEGDRGNRALLLENLKEEENRRAHFHCAVAIVFPDGEEYLAEGETYGNILREEVGDGGFGYDPIFESEDIKKSFGVASAEEKNSVSHRYRALMKMLEILKEEGRL